VVSAAFGCGRADFCAKLGDTGMEIFGQKVRVS
jgi:hypothetical protein